MNYQMKLEELHSKLKAHLKDQNEKWEHFIYSKQDGFYQGLDELNIKGTRSSEKRFKEYNLTKYLSKNKTALDIGSNCGFFSIFISKYVQHITGVEINPYLVAIANDTKQYLEIVNTTFNSSTLEDFKANDNEPNFEVDSIELVTPELFSDDGVINSTNDEKIEKQDLKMFENTNLETDKEIKEQEMFEDTNLEEDFEIPAFLRRQNN